jgi:hypothetical protein
MGLMEPVRVETDPKKGYVIIHRCTKCGEIHRNRAANEAAGKSVTVRYVLPSIPYRGSSGVRPKSGVMV